MVFFITTVDLGWGWPGSSGVEGRYVYFTLSTMITMSVNRRASFWRMSLAILKTIGCAYLLYNWLGETEVIWQNIRDNRGSGKKLGSKESDRDQGSCEEGVRRGSLWAGVGGSGLRELAWSLSRVFSGLRGGWGVVRRVLQAHSS